MRNERINREIDHLKTLLRNAKYRYKLALRDGAVSSIIKDVNETIHKLEQELLEKSGTNRDGHPERSLA